MLKVSVVVPAYNTGPYVEECAPSLLNQSLDPDEYEVIYVDDGSSDDTLARLQKLAAEHPNVQVHTQPNSGWPGKPRNVGMRHARGEYIQFVDHDDMLGREALERLYEQGKRNRADVVVGKISSTMVRPSRLFRYTVDVCTIDNDELMQSLSPHKMFRRAFLEEHGLRFPEGPWALEDQLFLSAAYLAAERISILADYPCYYWRKRDDGGNNIGSWFSERHDFFGNLRTVVRQIKSVTGPGDLQDRLLHRHYYSELLSRAREPEILTVGPQVQRPRFEAARRLALEEFPPSVRDGLPAVSRLRAELLERGDFDAAVELAKRTREIKVRTEVVDLCWQEGRLTADVRLSLERGGGEPLVLVERDGRLLLDPDMLHGVPGAGDWEVGDPFRLAYGELVVRDRDRGDWWYPPGDAKVWLEPLGGGRSQLVVTGRLCLDPLTLAGGRALERGVHDVWMFVKLLGTERLAPLTGDGVPGAMAAAGPALVGSPVRIAIPYWTTSGQLALDMDERLRCLADDLGHGPNARCSRRRLRPASPAVLPLPLAAAERLGVRVRIGEGKQAVTVPAELVPGPPPALRVPGRATAPAGRQPVVLVTSTRPAHKSQPVAYAVVRAGRITRLEGPGYVASAGQRLLDAGARNRQIRGARRLLSRAAGRVLGR
jgi:poly(ribitol-phosphate) beta-N-acetylglucosaminyltransferase